MEGIYCLQMNYCVGPRPMLPTCAMMTLKKGQTDRHPTDALHLLLWMGQRDKRHMIGIL